MKLQTTNHKPHNRTSFFAGAKSLALALAATAMIITAGGQNATAAGDNANDANAADFLASDSLRFRSTAGGDTFADMRRDMQLRLFSQWGDALSQKAEDALTGEFAAVKKAGVYLQTELAGRKGQFGAHVIGAIAESDHHAFNWQLRAYGGEDSTRGANAGLFVRRIGDIGGGVLFGGNVFVDYEDGEYGNFSRYGVGAEIQNRFFAVAANYYMPASDGRAHRIRQMESRNRVEVRDYTAFSRKGYDVNLRMRIPKVGFAKVRADYYRFDEKNGAKEDSGFRYGMEVHPLAGLRLGIFYDEGGQEVGGDIGYVYTIGETPVRYNSDNNFFSPDLFAPVLREYSQRVITTTITTSAAGG